VPWGLVALQGWLLDRLVVQHGRALLEQERLRKRVARVESMAADLLRRGPASTARAGEAGEAREPGRAEPETSGAALTTRSGVPSAALPVGAHGASSSAALSAGRAGADRLRAGEYADFQRLQDKAIRTAPAYPGGRFSGAGIVILAGGPRYYTNAWVCLTILRRVLGCRLPIQVWHLGPDEMSPRMIELLQRFDVECVDALEVRRRHPSPVLRGWECKPYAILHSSFQEVILLDADNAPLIDPAVLLSWPEYRATGAVFWPDIRSLGREHPIWEICRVPYRDEPEFETGQIVLDKERCWKALHLALHLNEQSDFYYRHVRGDKETFHMAWRMVEQPYGMPPHRPEQVTGLISSGDANYADVLYQHDFDGQRVFQHRTGAKWTAWGENFRVPGFRHHAACLEALQELRQCWDGRVDLAHVLARAPASEAELLRSRYFLYRRTGSDARVLTLLPGGRIGGGRGRGHWERTWRVERVEGEQDRAALVIEGQTGVTCSLTRGADGVWRGRWLRYEQMPVELIPLTQVSPEWSGPSGPSRSVPATQDRS
jgi:hypothetical protein